MPINLLNSRPYPNFIYDILYKAISSIPCKKEININLIPPERYGGLKDKKINIWNIEPILPIQEVHKRRRDGMEKAIKDSNVGNIFCFDLSLTKKYNVEKVKYLPLGFIEQMVTKNNSIDGKCLLGNMWPGRRSLLENSNIDVIDAKSYVSLCDTTNKIAKYKYGIDVPVMNEYINLYVNCIRISQYIMAGTIVVSDNNLIREFGVSNYIHLNDIGDISLPMRHDDNIAELALRELKQNVNMKDILLGYLE